MLYDLKQLFKLWYERVFKLLLKKLNFIFSMSITTYSLSNIHYNYMNEWYQNLYDKVFLSNEWSIEKSIKIDKILDQWINDDKRLEFVLINDKFEFLKKKLLDFRIAFSEISKRYLWCNTIVQLMQLTHINAFHYIIIM